MGDIGMPPDNVAIVLLCSNVVDTKLLDWFSTRSTFFLFEWVPFPTYDRKHMITFQCNTHHVIRLGAGPPPWLPLSFLTPLAVWSPPPWLDGGSCTTTPTTLRNLTSISSLKTDTSLTIPFCFWHILWWQKKGDTILSGPCIFWSINISKTATPDQ